jgi:hypothetical protein
LKSRLQADFGGGKGFFADGCAVNPESQKDSPRKDPALLLSYSGENTGENTPAWMWCAFVTLLHNPPCFNKREIWKKNSQEEERAGLRRTDSELGRAAFGG